MGSTTSATPVLGVIAGNGLYPKCMIEGARAAVPGIRIVMIAFVGETDPSVAQLADACEWFRVGQLSKPFGFLKKHGATDAVMVGQLAPKNLFTLRPDLKTLMMLARLPKRNAETIFGGIADEAEKMGIHILPANSYMDDFVPERGHIAGPKPSDRQMDDAHYGMGIAKEVSRLDIGQSVIVRHGTVLAVEGFEGTNGCIRRGGKLGHGKDATLAKVAKPGHDMRFDIPVVGIQTLETCHEAGVNQIVVEAGKTILLQGAEVGELCRRYKITLQAI